MGGLIISWIILNGVYLWRFRFLEPCSDGLFVSDGLDPEPCSDGLFVSDGLDPEPCSDGLFVSDGLDPEPCSDVFGWRPHVSSLLVA